MIYYSQRQPQIRYSLLKVLKKEYIIKPNYDDRLITLVSYCVMENHFHLLLRQEVDEGISAYIHRLIGSYSHYYNIRHHQRGPLFESRFKAVPIETEQQLIHVSRYIHLNPSSAGIVQDPANYELSSLKYYLQGGAQIPMDIQPVMSYFRSRDAYRRFIYRQQKYQRTLEKIKHCLLD